MVKGCLSAKGIKKDTYEWLQSRHLGANADFGRGELHPHMSLFRKNVDHPHGQWARVLWYNEKLSEDHQDHHSAHKS